MSTSSTTLKNGIANHHTPNDVVYLKQIRLSCPFCKTSGPPKIRNNLWRAHCHWKIQHSEENWQEIENKIYELIKEGILR